MKKYSTPSEFIERITKFGTTGISLPKVLTEYFINQLMNESMNFVLMDQKVEVKESGQLSLFDKVQSITQEQINKEIDDNKVCKL